MGREASGSAVFRPSPSEGQLRHGQMTLIGFFCLLLNEHVYDHQPTGGSPPAGSAGDGGVAAGSLARSALSGRGMEVSPSPTSFAEQGWRSKTGALTDHQASGLVMD
jgi:hypothetical protein